MPVDNAGNTNTNARSIGLLGSTAQSFNDYVGSDDTNDYYRFTLDSTRNLSLTLSGLSADADLMLFNSTGGLLRLSERDILIPQGGDPRRQVGDDTRERGE